MATVGVNGLMIASSLKIVSSLLQDFHNQKCKIASAVVVIVNCVSTTETLKQPNKRHKNLHNLRPEKYKGSTVINCNSTLTEIKAI